MNAADIERIERIHAHNGLARAHGDRPDLDELEDWLARLDDAVAEVHELCKEAPHLRDRLEIARRNLARARDSVWSELVSSGDVRGPSCGHPSGIAGGDCTPGGARHEGEQR